MNNGAGVSRAVVSDGLSSVLTDAEGRFELVSDRRARHCFVSVPRALELPVGPQGLGRAYVPLRFDAANVAQATLELQKQQGDGEKHRFLAFGDTQLDDAADAKSFLEETVPEVTEFVRKESPAFGVTCGDIVDDTLELFADYTAGVRAIGTPFFQVVGNHDLDVADGAVRSTRTFESHFGPAYYSFNRGAVHYVVLQDVLWLGNGYVGFLDEAQLAWLKSDLAYVEAGSTVVVFAHIPFQSTISERIGGKIAPDEAQVTNRERLYELLEPFRVHLITSHTHDNHHTEHGGCEEHILGPVCGAWWNGPIAWDGTPKGYHLFEANGGELSWRFRGLGLDPSTQIRFYPAGADRQRPADYVANVWNWDPTWKVYWLEDGERRGEMSRARGLDPMAVSLYEGPNRPITSGAWVEPVLTDHLFYAPALPGAKTVGVEAVDRWGRTYAENLRVE